MKAKIIVSLLLVFSGTVVLGQGVANALVGTYESGVKGSETYSIMILDEQNRFTYQYGIDGCRGEIKGSWRIEDQQLMFENDHQFLNDSVVAYPDMSLTKWSVKRIGIQPNDSVDSGCLTQKGLHKKTTVIPSHDYTVSMIRLISNPENYHNRKIQVIGYLNLEFEGNAIYLHKEDFEQNISENAFWVSFSDHISPTELKQLNKGYVLIAGTFNMENHGHMGLFSGEIMNIDRIIRWGK